MILSLCGSFSCLFLSGWCSFCFCFGSGCSFFCCFLSLSFSLCFCLCDSFSSLLVCYLLSDLCVGFLLSLKLSSSSCLLVGLVLSRHLTQALLLVSLPSVKLCLACCFVKSALLNTTTQVFHEINTFAGQDVANRVGGLCATLYPVQGTIEFQIYSGRIGVRVVRTNLLCKLTVTRCSFYGRDAAI